MRQDKTDERNLANYLGAKGASFSDFSVKFHDDERQDVILAAQGTVVVPLQHLGAIRASGEDASVLCSTTSFQTT